MPVRTITAEIDGKVRTITADIPDGASNDDVIAAVQEYVAQHPAPEPTVFGGVKEALKGAADAVPRGIATLLRPFYQSEQTVETPTTWQTPSQAATALLAFNGKASKPGEKATLPAMGVDAPAIKQAYDNSAMAKYLAPNEGYEQSRYRQVGSMVGGAVPYLLAGGIGGPYAVAALGAAQGAGTQGEIVDEARKQGLAVSPENERTAMTLGAGIGTIGALPMLRVTERIQGALQGAIGRGIAAQTGRTLTEAANKGATQMLASAATQALLGGVTGGAQQFANNAVERGLINPEQQYGEGVTDAAISGAIGGAIIDSTIGNLARKIEANQNAPKTTKKPLPKPKLNEHVGEHVDIGSEMYPEADIIPREVPDTRPPFFYDAEAEAARLPEPAMGLEQFYGIAPPEPAPFNPNAWGMRTATMPGAEAPVQSKQLAPKVSARTKPVEIAAEPSQVAGFAEALPVQNEIRSLYPDATPEQLLAEAQRYAKMSPEQRKATIESRLQAARTGAKPMYAMEQPAVDAATPIPDAGVPVAQESVPDAQQSSQPIEASQPNPTEWRKQAAGVGRTLRQFMDKVGAPDSMLRMVKTVEDYTAGNKQVPEAKAQYYKQGIQFAFNVADKMPERFGTIGHEVSHFFNDAGLYTPKELDVIFKRAKADGIADEIAANPEYQKQNLNEKQFKDEVVAHALERFVLNEYSPNGQSRGLLNRAKNFAERLANGFKREGFVTADDVMNRFLGGDIGARDRAQGIEVPTNGNIPRVNGALNRSVEADKEKPARTEDFPTERLAKYDEVAATEEPQKPMMAMRDRASLTPDEIAENDFYSRLNNTPDKGAVYPSKSGEPITVRHQKNGMYYAYQGDQNIGSASLNHKGYLTSVNVEPSSRRNGVASAIYDHVEQHSGVSLRPSPTYVSSDATAFWENRTKSKASPAATVTTPQDRILALVDADNAKGKRKSISAIRQESGLAPEEFDKAFLDLVRQDKIQANRADMPTERFKQFGYADEGDYVHDPVSGKPFLTASKESESPMYSFWKNRDMASEVDDPSELMSNTFAIKEEPKSLAARFLKAMKSFDGNRVRDYAADDAIRSQELDQMLGTTKANEGSYQANTWSRRSMALLAPALQHGAPVYEEGGFRIRPEMKNQGLIPFLAEIDASGKGNLVRWLHYQAADRGSYLLPDGREHLMTPQEIAKGKALGEKYPELKKFSEKYKKQVNDPWVDFLVATGYLSKEAAADWKSRPHLPFFRESGDDIGINRPSIRNAVGGVKSLKQLKGGTDLIADPIDSIVHNYAAMLDIGMKNVAANRTIRNLTALDWAEPAKTGDTNVVTHYVNGKKLRTKVLDPLSYEMLTRMNPPPGAVMQFLGNFSSVLRNAVTRTPTFMVKNVARDSVETVFKGDYNLIPFISALDGVRQAVGESSNYQALERAGITGGSVMIDPGRGAGSKLRRIIRKNDLTPTDRLLNLWDAAGEWMEKSEAANRTKIYEDVLKRTGDKTQAEWEALDVMNFSKRGSGEIIRMLTPLVPFMNARIQGMDMIAKVLTGSAYGGGERGAAAQKAAWMRGGIMLLASMMYAQAISGYKFWENAAPEERDNYWFIPTDEKGESAPIRIPVPFEVGALFKIFPERAWAYASGKDTGEDFSKAAARAALNNFAEVPIPQAVKPLAENYFNKSIYRGREIENQQMQALMPEDRWDDYTSMTAREIGAATGYSPLKIDNALKGYLGTMGVFGLSMLDRVLRPESQGERPADAIWNTPGIGTFFQRPDGAGKIMAYYDFDRKVDEVVNSIRRAQNSGNPERVREIVDKNRDMLAAKGATDSIGNALKQLRAAKQKVNNAPREVMNGEQKRIALDAIRAQEIQVSRQLDQLKERLKK